MGVLSTRNNVAAKNLPALPSATCQSALPLLTGYGSRSCKRRYLPPLDGDYAYLAGLSRSVMEEEMGKLTKFARCASTALTFGTTGHWEEFRSNWHCA